MRRNTHRQIHVVTKVRQLRLYSNLPVTRRLCWSPNSWEHAGFLCNRTHMRERLSKLLNHLRMMNVVYSPVRLYHISYEGRAGVAELARRHSPIVRGTVGSALGRDLSESTEHAESMLVSAVETKK